MCHHNSSSFRRSCKITCRTCFISPVSTATNSAEMEGPTRRKASSDGNNSAAGVPDRKRLKSPPASHTIDRFSALPECLIVRILSLLPTLEDKVRTGALARKWQYLWTRVPNLYFVAEDEEYSHRFVNCVDETLILCGGPSVKSFGVAALYDPLYASDFNRWTRFAARNEIENFQLDLDCLNTSDIQFYPLPQLLFLNSTFQELLFRFCDFAPKRPVCWNSLKKLSVSACNFGSEALEMVLAGTPSLEILDLSLIRGTYNLHFGDSGLKKLIVCLEKVEPFDDLDTEAHLEISAPNVQSFEIGDCFHTCQLVDMSSLVEATISYMDIKDPISTQEFLRGLWNVQTLILHTSIMEGQDWSDEYWTSEKAKANLDIMKHHVIRTGQDWSDRYWTYGKEASSYLSHLTTVVLCGFFFNYQGSISFVQLVLKNAKVLRKMIIYLGMKGNSRSELFETCQKLLSFPRSSPHAELLIYE